MQRWKLSLGLAATALGAALLAPRLLPLLQGQPEPETPLTKAVIEAPPDVPAVLDDPTPRTIDLVIALDTSGSMERLIDSTRARLWDIVNEIDAQDRDATLRVGLITYGSPVYGEANGYVKVQVPLTEDLDAVYAKALQLETRGGDEYVGATISTAVSQMAWAQDDNPDNRRLLFIAGNETARLGPIAPNQAAANAVSNGIHVNMLFAGGTGAGLANHWGEVAAAGNGRYLAIDAGQSAVAVATPYDADLRDLNTAMNRTYVTFDAASAAKLDQIVDNDRSAYALGSGSGASRVGTKGSSKHKVDSWDLVEANANGNIDFDDFDASALNGGLAGLGGAELKNELNKRAKDRADIKADIQEIQAKRVAHIRDASEAEPGAGLDEAMTQILTDQL